MVNDWLDCWGLACFISKEGLQKLSHVKGTTLIVTALALMIALSGNQSVFNLVIFAWSGFGASLAPLLIVDAPGKQPTQRIAVIMMITGILIVIIWRHLGWHTYIYEGMPGVPGVTDLYIFIGD